jgi:toxin ParE1/3/4
MKFEFHPEAERELHEAAAYYEASVPGLGDRFGDEVERVITLVLDHPEMGAKVDRDLRHFVLTRFPFSVVYGCIDDLVYVVAIAHGSREPEYWKHRRSRG